MEANDGFNQILEKEYQKGFTGANRKHLIIINYNKEKKTNDILGHGYCCQALEEIIIRHYQVQITNGLIFPNAEIWQTTESKLSDDLFELLIPKDDLSKAFNLFLICVL